MGLTSFPLRRLLSVATIGACLLFLGQVPMAHFASSIRPSAADLPVPADEEQRSEIGERVLQATMASRHRRHVSYQETVEPAPSFRYHRGTGPSGPFDRPPPPVFPGSPRPLRC